LSLREYLSEKDANGEIIRIKDALSPVYDIPAVIKMHDGEGPILFENVTGFSNSVVANVCNSRMALCDSLNVSIDSLHEYLDHAVQNPMPCKVEERKNKSRTDLLLTDIPILTHYKGEQGPYITSGLVYAKNPTGEGENVSYHRMDVIAEDKLSICVQPGHLKEYIQQARDAGMDHIDISISIGNHPATMIAAALRPPKNVSEYDVANTLLKGELKLSRCPNVDALSPSSAELVIEGRLKVDETAPEGPYVCVTGTMKESKLMPVVEVVSVIHGDDYVYQGLLGGGLEHRLLESIPNEVKLWKKIKGLGYDVRGVHMTPCGSSWLHGVVSFRKTAPIEGEILLRAMFEEIPALKHAFIVDADINPYELSEVEWALSTRFQGDKDLLIIPDSYASRLDPSSDLGIKKGCKLGFDVTIKRGNPESYLMGEIPVSERVKKLFS
jgi:anhydromevalonate phosphate decarboxylase